VNTEHFEMALSGLATGVGISHYKTAFIHLFQILNALKYAEMGWGVGLFLPALKLPFVHHQLSVGF
jgi:hypothetical protein